MDNIIWIIVAVIVVGVVAWYMTSRKKGPEQETKRPEGPMPPPPAV